MVTGLHSVADHGVGSHPHQTARLADAAVVGEVAQDSDDLVLRQAAVEQGRALAFGEAGLAGAAAEQTAPLGAIAVAHAEVTVVALAVVGAGVVLAAEVAEVVVHAPPSVAAIPNRGCPRTDKSVQNSTAAMQY